MIIGSKLAISLQRGSVDPKFQVQGVAPTKHSPSQKTRINGVSYNVKIWTDFSFVLSQCTPLTDGETDRWKDRILIVRPRLHSMQRSKNGSQKQKFPIWKSRLSSSYAIPLVTVCVQSGHKVVTICMSVLNKTSPCQEIPPTTFWHCNTYSASKL